MTKLMTWPLVFILLVGWGLSIRQWDADGLWYDEVWSVYNAGGPPDGPLSPPEIAHRLATEDPDQGLAYPLILAAWGSLVGWMPFAGRALSALFGLLTASLVARLGRRIYNASAGASAAALMLLSPFFIYYTHELRVFTIVALSVAGLLWTYLNLMVSHESHVQRRSISMLGFIISGLGLLYTHYFAATILIAVGLMHGVRLIAHIIGRQRGQQKADLFVRRWLRVSLLFVITGLLFVPWLPVFVQSLQRTSTREDVHAKALAAPDLLEHVAYYLGSGLTALTVLLLILGLWAAWRRGGWTRWSAVTALVSLGVVTGFNAVLQIIEPGRVRYLIVLWPPLALVMGMGSAYLLDLLTLFTPRKDRFMGPVLALILIGALGLNGVRANFDSAYLARMEQKWTPPWQQMTRIIQDFGGPQDVFLFYAGEDHYRHHYPFTFVTRGLPLAAPAAITEVLADSTYGPGIEAQIKSAARVWYGIDKTQAERPVFDQMQVLLDDMYHCETVIDTPQFSFALYVREPINLCFSWRDPLFTYGDQVALTARWPFGWTERSLPVSLLWHVSKSAEGTLSVSIQVLDEESGQPVAQRDVGIPNGPYGLMQEMLDLSALPAGRYRVVAIVYRWQTGERLIGTSLSGEAKDMWDIGYVELKE